MSPAKPQYRITWRYWLAMIFFGLILVAAHLYIAVRFLRPSRERHDTPVPTIEVRPTPVGRITSDLVVQKGDFAYYFMPASAA